MKFFNRRKEKSEIDVISETARKATEERKRSASRVLQILDCAADASDKALAQLTDGDRVRGLGSSEIASLS